MESTTNTALMPVIAGTEWRDYHIAVLGKLNDHSVALERVLEKVEDIDSRLGKIEVKSGLLGAIAGCVPVMFLLLKEKLGIGS